MKRGKRSTALILALVLILGLTAEAGAAEVPETDTAYLRDDVAVAYDGEIQVLRDAAGTTVYPLSYHGTTYVPVRAVGNVLGVAVDWDQKTRSVLLSDPAGGRTPIESTGSAADPGRGPEEIEVSIDRGITVRYNGEVQTLEDAEGNQVYPISYNGTTYLPIRAVGGLLGVGVDWDEAAQTVLLTGPEIGGNARILGRDHIGSDWVELDWSTAGDGYITVKVNELPDGPSARCGIRLDWERDGRSRYSNSYKLTKGEWNIPLPNGSTAYTVRIDRSFLACEHYLTDEEKRAYDDPGTPLTARFVADITDTDTIWLLSTPSVNFENAPATRAKALEITKDCKTDADAIAAVFNWVAQNMSYDHGEAERLMALEAGSGSTSCAWDPVNGRHTPPPDSEELGYTDQDHLDLDTVLARRSGVCAQYAALMAGMLRSLGIPCQVVGGDMRTSDGKWWSHAWVAVRPETGELDLAALGGGMDYPDRDAGKTSELTGWFRLDPTNGLRNPEAASNDENYIVESHH